MSPEICGSRQTHARTFTVDDGEPVRGDVKVAQDVYRGDVRERRHAEVLSRMERLRRTCQHCVPSRKRAADLAADFGFVAEREQFRDDPRMLGVRRGGLRCC